MLIAENVSSPSVVNTAASNEKLMFVKNALQPEKKKI